MIRRVPRLVALGVVAAVINVGGAQLARMLSMPLALDAVGTVLAAALLGWWPGALAGALSQSVLALHGVVWLAFVPVHLVVAFYTVRAVRSGWFGGVLGAAGVGVVLGAVSAAVAWPVAFLLFGGVLGSPLAPARDLLTAAGVPLRWAAYGARGAGELLDKVVTAMLVYGAVRLLRARVAAGGGENSGVGRRRGVCGSPPDVANR